jgi:hypothetical protein
MRVSLFPQAWQAVDRLLVFLGWKDRRPEDMPPFPFGASERLWAWLTERDLTWTPDMLLIDPTRRTLDDWLHTVSACRAAIGSIRIVEPLRPAPRADAGQDIKTKHENIQAGIRPPK